MISIIQRVQSLRLLHGCKLVHHQKCGIKSSYALSSQSLIYNRDTGIISSTSSITCTNSDNDGTEKNQINTPSIEPLFHTVIGIEIHAQLAVPTKFFSSSPTKHSNFKNGQGSIERFQKSC